MQRIAQIGPGVAIPWQRRDKERHRIHEDTKMTPRHAATLYLFAMFTSTGVASADEGRPTNYDQCITDSMKGVGSDVAARAIIASCRNQFPDTAPGEVVPASPAPAAAAPVAATESKSAAPAAAPQAVPAAAPQAAAPVVRDLTDAELANLNTSAFVFSDSYRFTVHNGNDGVTLGEVTVEIWNESRPKDRRRYTEAVNIAPLSTGTVHIKDVDPKARYDSTWTPGSDAQWAIIAAKTR